jgi:hypothetical protein
MLQMISVLKMVIDNRLLQGLHEDSYGNKRWYLNGNLHREDGPAVEYKIGTNLWYINGYLHRDDGPAEEYYFGDKHWWANGFRHRIDGPAIIRADRYSVWYYNGKVIPVSNQKQFESYIKMMVFI